MKGVVAIDGDTIRLEIPRKNLCLWLWGISAPKIGGPRRVEVRCALAALVEGGMLACELMDVDRYWRPVVRFGTVKVPDPG